MQKAAITTFPTADRVFHRVVQRLAGEATSGSTAELAARLRPLFPKVAVFERQLSGEGRRVYVYRDGRYRVVGGERWWEELGVACVMVDAATGRLTSVNEGATRAMGVDAAALVGRHFAEFVMPEAQDVAATIFEAVSEEREVRSEAMVVRPDGSRALIEFRATRQDSEIELLYRLIEDEVPEPASERALA